jgi:penicillin-binding protein 1A
MRDVGRISSATLVSIGMVSTAAVAGGFIGLSISFRRLPDVRLLENYTPVETSYVYDMDGTLLSRLHDEANRDVVTLDEISPHLKRAVIAIEDNHFYRHHGINLSSVARAFLRNFREGETVEGASTLTMQLVKNLFLTPEQTINRKLAEAVLAIRMEQVFSKDKILELYLNQVYWGHNTYGVETAAQSYFNKSAADLNLAEASMMAALIQAPERYSPFIDFETAKEEQAVVLTRMRGLNWITAAEEEAAKTAELDLGKVTSFSESQAPYVTDAVTQEMTRRFGRGTLLKGGMRVQTTIDLELQIMAQQVVRWGHAELSSSGYYADEVALIAVEPYTHFVKAVVGGIDYERSQFNRATQARRQPGSSFKPFVYYAAFASGQYDPFSIIDDNSVSYPDGASMYTPRNYDGTFWGPITLKTALVHSRNIPAIKLGHDISIERVIQICRALGLKGPMEPVLPLTLGAVEVSPIEMANAFATFASQGWHAEPTFIAQVTDGEGTVLLDNIPAPQLVLDPQATLDLTMVMEGVIEEGSGTAAQLPYRPAAGKTGTTDSARDAWFVGYVPQLAAAVWVGNDDNYPIGGEATGGDLAAPIWRDFMVEATRDLPPLDFYSLEPAENIMPGSPNSSTGVTPQNGANPQTSGVTNGAASPSLNVPNAPGIGNPNRSGAEDASPASLDVERF